MKPHSTQANALTNSTPPPRKYIRYLRMAAWNAAFIISGLLLIALIGEAYFRLTRPFIGGSHPSHFVDGVGSIREPNAEMRHADWSEDNFVASRVNSQGFLDREPLSAKRAAEGCHIAFIGDSFVEAKETLIADKFHAQLEEMAARELPHLKITTQAYGIGDTGQINQLPFYDEYARHLSPKLVILVFYINDFTNNSVALQSVMNGLDPDRMPFMSVRRDERGALKLRPPDPEFRRFRLPQLPDPWYNRAWKRLVKVSYFAKWLRTKDLIPVYYQSRPIAARADMIATRPCCSSLLDGWQPANGRNLDTWFTEEHLPPVFEEAVEYTAFGIEQFKRRADRDGAALAILSATQDMGTRGDPQFDRLSAIAEARDIPVISQYDYIVSQGHDYKNGRWRFDEHWNPTGHQWAAEAVLEWLTENQDVCD